MPTTSEEFTNSREDPTASVIYEKPKPPILRRS